MAKPDFDYHRQRAQAELDWGYRAGSNAAGEAHFRLASLHLERIRAGSSPDDDAALEESKTG